ncbi:MAG: hypothetical protein COZ37_07080 [bacterium (Candidatus Ratteibacteria) CG_4_10_14_3_um_filter_41_18]|uniref:Uncharacterized protein n=3 Tax=Candidatus Ratteibacteria TaxID=2979319 RepID=A0A2M7YH59_9BACT|nr:MAG: hypothetical protein COW28_03290 [bacterium (Candidatus Ratteibacteria) CG15_BIG_FIL_POST_REV_8_21_14_020_41_12]PIX76597.1 MAG: hypothetical protein COZ37_07080 [bacterium (Candidatus Ratteibacteria) CG_4_10_14_3_um_filter_41_18]PJA62311.1 MAG: hypothetical protein CO162_01720 [bacterium (Candidatus Ratteibacteria) CG_4_9_14_3_um_filter_41_21]
MEEKKYIPPEEKFKYKGLSESDTRVKIIDPQLHTSNWEEEDIKREFYFKKGKVTVEGNEAKRGEKKFAGYLLLYKRAFPIAVIEAKHRIVKYLDSLQSKVNALKELQSQIQKEIEELKKSILDKAFKGEL